MDPLTYLADTRGFFTRGQARDCGYDDRAIAAAVRHGDWVRFRHGYYSLSAVWRGLDELGRYRVRCAAVLDSLGEAVALSHVSALAVSGVATWGLSLDHVHVTRLDKGAGRIEAGVVHHEGFWTKDDLVDCDGLLCTVPDRAALEAGIRVGNEVALSVLDSTLHETDVAADQLMRRFELMQSWPGIRHLHIPVRMADARSESPGESRGRWLWWTCGLPAPELQYKIYDADGVLRGTTDWGWPDDELLGEFDGQHKYGRLLKPGQDPGEVVFAEKHREDVLRELTGFRMIRVIWSDYDRPRVTAGRLRRMLSVAS